MHWYMLTLVGEDRPGIVARVTQTLYEAGAHLGEADMARLGGNFCVMLMVHTQDTAAALATRIEPVVAQFGLRMHVDAIEGHLHHHPIPNIRVTVHGADRPGIVAQVTGLLLEGGFNILDLQTAVGGTRDRPVYIMTLEGESASTVANLQQALQTLSDAAITIDVQVIETLIG